LCRKIRAADSVRDVTSLDHAKDADKIVVVASKVPPCVWGTFAAKRYFPINPQEWDAEYKAGVAFIENSLRDFPAKWNLDWIHRNINGCAKLGSIAPLPPHRQG
jgi:hypothetical protein